MRLCTSRSKQSSLLNFFPTSLLESCHSVFFESIAYRTNLSFLSFKQGLFPSAFNTAVITPLLKNPGLNTSLPSNYCPISNLNTTSKIIEHLFLNCDWPHIVDHLTSISSSLPTVPNILLNLHYHLLLTAYFTLLTWAIYSTLLTRSWCCLQYHQPFYSIAATWNKLLSHWPCLFLAWILPNWPLSVCKNWQPFLSTNLHYKCIQEVSILGLLPLTLPVASIASTHGVPQRQYILNFHLSFTNWHLTWHQ